jgi:UDP-N-acetylglucosamine 2-epimerase (non-hydrolysing)
MLVTLHRPSNVDDPDELRELFAMFSRLAERMPVVLPIHPRTRKMLESADPPIALSEHISLLDPVGYLEFVGLMKSAGIVVTDSGGIQEETTVLGVPCVTVRENTERPITIEVGTNILAGTDPARVEAAVNGILDNGIGEHSIPPLWDGKTAGRIADILEKHFP